MTTATERRRDGRAAPPADWRIRVAQRVSEAADWFARNLYTKALLASLLIAALAVVFWSMTMQLRTANEYNSAIQREVSLQLALDDLKATVLRLQYQKLEDQIEAAEQRLIPDYGTLASWLYQMQAASASQGIVLTYTVNEEQHLEDRPGLLAVPLVLTVQAQENSQAEPYGAGLALLRRLAEGPWAGELVAAFGEGEGRGLTRMNFEYRIWMRTRDGFDGDPSHSPDEGEGADGGEAASLVSAQTDLGEVSP